MINRNGKYTALLLSTLLVVSSFCFTSSAYGDTGTESTNRLWGKDKYETSRKICEKWGKSDYAIVATGDDYADALCAAPLAKQYDAPIILTESSKLSDDARETLKNLGVSKVIIVGGTGVVSKAVESSIAEAGIKAGNIQRICGKDRYETSEKIAQSIISKSGKIGNIALASGEGFADALSIAPIAAIKGMPILLTKKTAIPENISSFIKNEGFKGAYVVGGEGAVSGTVESSLDSILPQKAKRLSGKDRYETNINIIKEFEKDIKLDTVYVAVGERYADALSGAALAARNGMPMILVDSSKGSDAAVDYFKEKGVAIKIVALGGEGVVPDSIISMIEQAAVVVIPPPAGPSGPPPVISTTNVFKNDVATIEVNGSEAVITINKIGVNDIATVVVYKKGTKNAAYLGQDDLKDGKCQLTAQFDRGDYTGYVSYNGATYSLPEFSIN